MGHRGLAHQGRITSSIFARYQVPFGLKLKNECEPIPHYRFPGMAVTVPEDGGTKKETAWREFFRTM